MRHNRINMKTINQIKRYTQDCRFSEQDWQQVLDYCGEHFKRGLIHVAKYPKSQSTYQQFLDWMDHGLGSGDVVQYGKTKGIVKTSTPDVTILAAYLDFNGNLIVNDMEVMTPSRLISLDKEEHDKFKKLLFDNGYEYSLNTHTVDPIDIPKKYAYAKYTNKEKGIDGFGIFLEADDDKYYFEGFYDKDKKELKLPYEVEKDSTPLRLATLEEVNIFHEALVKRGKIFDHYQNKIVDGQGRTKGGRYYYLTETFQIAQDIDSGKKIHTERYKAGNYMTDYVTALNFMSQVIKLRGKKR